MTILPAAYLPSIEYFAYLLRGGCVVDLGEHFIKRSERNRACILAPNGVQDLTVQVRHANRPRTPMHDVRIDYSKHWQHQHWGALVAAYKGSPYFDHFAPRFEPFYKKEYGFLAEYDLALLAVLCEQLRIPLPRISESYVEAGPGDLDLRPKARVPAVVGGAGPVALIGDAVGVGGGCGSEFARSVAIVPAISSISVAPGAPLPGGPDVGPGVEYPQQKSPAFVAEPYVQVFADRMPFAPNLSVADLLFAEGPSAVSVLKCCLR